MKEYVKKILLWIVIFLTVYLLGTIMFIALFHTPVLNHMNVLMYRGVGLLVLSGIFVAVISTLVKRFIYRKLEGKDIVMMFLMFCCVNMVLFTLIPVTVERSVSVFMLSYMSDHEEQVYTEDDIEEVFLQYYVEEYGAFAKRFEEQEITGTIDPKDGGYQITDKGKFLVKMFRMVGDLFDTDRRLLYSEEKIN